MEKVSRLQQNARPIEIVRTLNKLVDAHNNGSKVAVGPGLEVYVGAAGTFISEMRMPTDMVRGISKQDGGGGGTVTTAMNTFFARINSYIAMDEVDGKAVNQWYYNFVEVGYDDEIAPANYEMPYVIQSIERRKPQDYMMQYLWYKVQDGRNGEAMNLRENQNFYNGIQGNGIDLDNEDLPAGFAIQPCPVGEVVVMHEVAGNRGKVYFFEYSNAFDGSCE